MTRINKKAVVKYSANQMYALVNNIEAYPDFLPWCTGASITTRDSDTLIAVCLLYTSPSPRDGLLSRMPSSA